MSPDPQLSVPGFHLGGEGGGGGGVFFSPVGFVLFSFHSKDSNRG